jgi:hypothetical protein
LNPHHRFDDAFDGTVILLDDVVQLFVLPNLVTFSRFSAFQRPRVIQPYPLSTEPQASFA